MSIQSEIDRISGNVQDTISAIQQTGVTVPEGANSDNLPSLAAALANEKQDKLTGTSGQFVGFDSGGNATAVAAPTAASIGAVPTSRTVNGKALNSNITLSAGDVGALPLSGGTLTGNLTGEYITGTWLQATATTSLGAAATKIAVFDGSGWLYYRTPAQIRSDGGGAPLASPTFTGTPKAPASATDYTTARLRNIRAGTADLTAGSSSLNSGEIYLVYE